MWFNRVSANGAISPGQWQDMHLKKTWNGQFNLQQWLFPIMN